MQVQQRSHILDAAEKRFGIYGYNKTTMAEIAGDSKMSAANLYRFFKNKQDITAACALRTIARQQDILREVVQRDFLLAADKLREFVVTGLRYTHNLSANNKKINELIEYITLERKDIVHQKIQSQCVMISEILQQGNQTGEFDIKNIEITAQAVHNSIIKFNIPIFMALHPLEEFEVMANEVVDVLLNGLSK